MSEQMEITIIVDTNDGDYNTEISKITQKNLTQIMPLIKAIKNFKPYKVKLDGTDWKHSHNYPYGECLRKDLGEKSPQELYQDINEDIIEFFEEEFLPIYSEYGFHTISSIEICPFVEKTKLL